MLSHFLLDALVHTPELPLWGHPSPKVGLGLWNHLWLEVGLELAMVAVALVIYLRCTAGTTPLGKYGMAAFVIALSVVMTAGQLTMTDVPGRTAMAATWMGQAAVISAVVFWLDRQRVKA